MNITRKKFNISTKRRNNADKIHARAIYAADINIAADENIVFSDETGSNQHNKRSYGYSSKKKHM